MSIPITLRDLYNALRDKLALEWIAGRAGSERTLKGDFPGAGSQGLAGTLNCIHPNRIQILSRAELIYFASLEKPFVDDMLEKLFAALPAAVLLADSIEVDPELITRAERSSTPLLRSSLPDNRLLNDLQYYLSHVMAERTTLHGVFMEVLSLGVLLTGESAIGKSELALELISRNHRMIADDAPEFARIAPDIIKGSSPTVLQDFLEVRGLGLLNIRAMFGDSAIKPEKYLQLIIHLQNMSDQELQKIDRLKGSYATQAVLGLQIPKVTLPVAPGREMAILVEAAVRQHMLRLNGYDTAEDFMKRQQSAIQNRRARGDS